MKTKHLFIVAIIMIIALLSSCNQTETITCGECGADVSSDALICTKCGSSVTKETALAPEATQGTETTLEPEESQSPEVTADTETTKVPETTKAPETTSAPETTEAPHIHAWSSWITTLNATCTEEGKQERSCSCGEKETQSIATVAHTEVIDKAVAATCTQSGLTEGKRCSVCKTITVAQTTIPAKGHSMSNGTCTVCGYTDPTTTSNELKFRLNKDLESYQVDCGNYTAANIVIPATYKGLPVTKIGQSAFENCTSLTSVTIPDSITEIALGAFRGCSSLTSITIPDGVTRIGDSAFKNCTSLTSVTIPSSVTKIEGPAFDGCKNLTSVTFSDGITCDINSFSGCTSLTSINIPYGVTGITGFNRCSSLTSVIIPNSVTILTGFNMCTSLTSITIPEGVTLINYSSFQACTSLTSITLPKSLEGIGVGSFRDCSALKDVYYAGTETEWNAIVWIDEVEAFKNATIHFNSKN